MLLSPRSLSPFEGTILQEAKYQRAKTDVWTFSLSGCRKETGLSPLQTPPPTWRGRSLRLEPLPEDHLHNHPAVSLPPSRGIFLLRIKATDNPSTALGAWLSVVLLPTQAPNKHTPETFDDPPEPGQCSRTHRRVLCLLWHTQGSGGRGIRHPPAQTLRWQPHVPHGDQQQGTSPGCARPAPHRSAQNQEAGQRGKREALCSQRSQPRA